jgi:hypothetical protein
MVHEWDGLISGVPVAREWLSRQVTSVGADDIATSAGGRNAANGT